MNVITHNPIDGKGPFPYEWKLMEVDSHTVLLIIDLITLQKTIELVFDDIKPVYCKQVVYGSSLPGVQNSMNIRAESYDDIATIYKKDKDIGVKFYYKGTLVGELIPNVIISIDSYSNRNIRLPITNKWRNGIIKKLITYNIQDIILTICEDGLYRLIIGSEGIDIKYKWLDRIKAPGTIKLRTDTEKIGFIVTYKCSDSDSVNYRIYITGYESIGGPYSLMIPNENTSAGKAKTIHQCILMTYNY